MTNTPPPSVRGLFGAERKRVSDERHAFAVRRRLDGATYKEIAEELGVHQSRVQQMVKAHLTPKPRVRIPPVALEARIATAHPLMRGPIIAALRRGVTEVQIVTASGIPRKRLWGALRDGTVLGAADYNSLCEACGVTVQFEDE